MLRFLAGARAGDVVAVAEGDVALGGRAPGVALALDGPNVSRHHLRFAWDQGQLVVENLSRINALWVNGVRQAQARLRRWDIVVVGPHVMRVDAVPGDTEPPRGAGEPLLAALLAIQRLIAAGEANLVERCLNALIEALPATRLALFTVDAEGRPEQGATATRGAAGTAMSAGFARQVLAAGRPMLLETAGAAAVTTSLAEVYTVIGAPVPGAEGALGVILADNADEPRILNHAHLGVLEIVAQALAAAFARERGRAAERQRLRVEAEFEAARTVQRHFAGTDPSGLAGDWRWAVRLQPALELSGDWVDAVALPAGALWLVTDVSGKGLPAALVTGMLKVAFRSACQAVAAAAAPSPGAVLRHINQLVAGQLPAMMFFTAVAVLAGPGGRIRWASVGHPAALAVGSDGRVRRLEGGNGILGSTFLMPVAEALADHDEVLASGERLVILTDGVVEAPTADGGMLGDEGVEACLARCGTGVEATADALVAAGLAAVGDGRRQADDITVVVGTPVGG
jgi:serine phosphatase RsbU (regulator of sigma subunit)